MSHILEIKDLQVQYHTEDGTVYALNHVDLELDDGETLGLVGETGAGKTTLAKSIMRLIPDPPGKIEGGVIEFEGRDLLKASGAEIRAVRGNQISMIFQDPMTSLNPLFTPESCGQGRGADSGGNPCPRKMHQEGSRRKGHGDVRDSGHPG